MRRATVIVSGAVRGADGRGTTINVRFEKPSALHGADGANELSVQEGLIPGVDRRKFQFVRVGARRQNNAEAVPGVSAEVFIPLIEPGLVGFEHHPVGVVESRIGVMGIVTGLEAPFAAHGDDGVAARDEGNGGGVSG